MNITELARRVKLQSKELRELLPLMGYDVGQKAIKINSKIAQEVIQKLNNKKQREKYLSLLSEPESDDLETNEEEKKSDGGVIYLPTSIVVKDFAKELKIDSTKLVMELMKQGVMASVTDKIDFETASIIAEDFGFKTEKAVNKKEDLEEDEDVEFEIKNKKYRPPVIVIMGHVDHGKTSLLDAIRNTDVALREKGGITQHIGAYQIPVSFETESGVDKLTFIDTPGHEAFSMMRSRGAKIADIAVLVVAADDGVKPQTIEALSHIRKSELPFIVAINKIDKEEANVEKIKKELSELNVIPEEWGGDTMMVPVSAVKETNIDEFLKTLILLYEVEKENMIADPDGNVIGTVIETHIDKGAGPVATVLIQNGTLRVGTDIIAGDAMGRIRMMRNWKGEKVNEAPPSYPVVVLGFKSVPQVGSILCTAKDKEDLKKKQRDMRKRASVVGFKNKVLSQKKESENCMNILIKADVLGSLEALEEMIIDLDDKITDVKINIIDTGLGLITDSDILMASGVDALVLGFNTEIMPEAEELIVSKKVDAKVFYVVYDLLDYIKEKAKEVIKPKTVREDIGKAVIAKIFKTEGNSIIAGFKVKQDKVENKTKVEIVRDKKIIDTGFIEELQSGKQNVNEVVLGQEGGMKIVDLSDVEDIQEGDMVVCYKEVEQEVEI